MTNSTYCSANPTVSRILQSQNLSPVHSLCISRGIVCIWFGVSVGYWETSASLSQFTSIISATHCSPREDCRGKLNYTTQGSTATFDLYGILLWLSNHVTSLATGGSRGSALSHSSILLHFARRDWELWVTWSLTGNWKAQCKKTTAYSKIYIFFHFNLMVNTFCKGGYESRSANRTSGQHISCLDSLMSIEYSSRAVSRENFSHDWRTGKKLRPYLQLAFFGCHIRRCLCIIHVKPKSKGFKPPWCDQVTGSLLTWNEIPKVAF